MKLKNLAIILLIILLGETAWSADQTTKEGDYWKGTCSCQCKGTELSATAIYKTGFLQGDGPASANATRLCHEQCARSCGGYTDCSSDDNGICATCCKTTFCSTNYFDATQPMPDKCELSCSSSCSYKGLVNSIVLVIYYVAGTIGALMIIINGLRLVTSQDPNDRNAAKNGIIFVIIALIIIILAATLVGLFMSSATTPLI